MPTSNPLPPKENTFFKRILKCYEQKQYKNGLKFAKQILSNPKYAEHGETLAMKGLTLNCLGRKEEAYDHVRRGLRNDLRSHVCWHVYGLLQRSDRKYDEAIKCYVNALKWDKDNPQILKDLALLQIQVRDLEGYRDTRYQLLISRPNQRQSWIGYAMSCHLLNNHDLAIKILDEFRKTVSEPKLPDYETSELVLYQNMLLVESGLKKEALKHLQLHENEIVDKLAVQELTARLHLEMDSRSDAAQLYRKMILRNPENWSYYRGLEKALGAENEEDRMRIYDEFRVLCPRSSAPQTLPLEFATGDRFRQLVDQFLRKNLTKGVPPLFIQLRNLYTDPEKVRCIEDLLLGYINNLKEHGMLGKPEEAGCGDPGSPGASELREPPTTQLWTNYFLAEHYDHLGQHKKAIEILDQQIEHTPTLIELHILRGRVFKHAQNIVEAVRCLDEAQSLDTADRYINCKCAKYMLRANMIKEAEEMCSKFTREGVPAVDNLNEMQCMWFQTECAAANRRLRKYGHALKKCHEVDRHFTEIVEDQFDFHTYCMRKFTLRSYMGLLRLEDQLRSHPFYFKAAKIAIELYVHLYDSPITDSTASQNEDAENLSPSELKKQRNKQRRAEKKAALMKERAKQELEKKEQNKPKPQDVELDGPKEEELVPEKLEKPDDPLEQAIYFLRPLLLYANDRIDTHCLAFEIYSRKGKLLLMLQAIKRGHRVDKNHPQFHRCSVKFLKTVRDSKDLDATVRAVLDREMEPIYATTDALALNRQFLEANINSYPHIVAGAHMMYYLDASSQAKALQLVTNFQQETVKGFTVKESLNAVESLERGDFGPCPSQLDAFKARCHRSFPYATTLFPSQHVISDSALAPNQNTANCANGES